MPLSYEIIFRWFEISIRISFSSSVRDFTWHSNAIPTYLNNIVIDTICREKLKLCFLYFNNYFKFLIFFSIEYNKFFDI